VNYGNYDAVLQQVRSAGLLVDALKVGTLHRCRVDGLGREKRGWTRLHEVRLKGGDFVIGGSFGIWQGNDPGAVRVELGKIASGMSAEERQALRTRLAEDRKAEQARRRAEAARAARRAQAAWAKLEPQGESDYLTRKGIQSHGLRFSASGTLVVPMLDTAGQIHGLQLIYPSGHPRRKRLGRDKDFWPRASPSRGITSASAARRPAPPACWPRATPPPPPCSKQPACPSSSHSTPAIWCTWPRRCASATAACACSSAPTTTTSASAEAAASSPPLAGLPAPTAAPTTAWPTPGRPARTQPRSPPMGPYSRPASPPSARSTAKAPPTSTTWPRSRACRLCACRSKTASPP
jgi:hypothetical protein